MRFFLSAETTGPADGYLRQLRLDIQPRLNTLEDTSYGEELTSIGIISTVLPEEILKGWYKERRYFSHKNKEADIRLRLDYITFIRAKPEERREMYINHIIASIKTLEHKLSKDFDFQRLLSDVNYSLQGDVKKSV